MAFSIFFLICMVSFSFNLAEDAYRAGLGPRARDRKKKTLRPPKMMVGGELSTGEKRDPTAAAVEKDDNDDGDDYDDDSASESGHGPRLEEYSGTGSIPTSPQGSSQTGSEEAWMTPSSHTKVRGSLEKERCICVLAISAGPWVMAIANLFNSRLTYLASSSSSSPHLLDFPTVLILAFLALGPF